MKFYIFILAIFAFSSATFAKDKPTWCSEAKTDVQRRICENDTLIDLDYQLRKVYSNVQECCKKYDKSAYKLLIHKFLLISHKRWEKRRDEECKDMQDSCIQERYKQRLNYLYKFVLVYKSGELLE